MEKKSVNRWLMFLLLFLIVVGVFLLYSRLTFTGYVTKIINATTGETISITNFDVGDSEWSGSMVVGENITLYSTKTSGYYNSQVFDAGQNAVWMNFASNYSVANDSTNSVIFKVRTCNDYCSNENFSVFNGDLNLIGRYFQYRVEMSRVNTSVESPVLFDVSVSYYLPISLPIVIESPQSITYNNETPVPINISTNVPNATILFSYDGGANETYNGTVNQMFTPGPHTLTAWIIYVEGNITQTNFTSVTFSVESKQTFYKIINGTCTAEDIFPSQKTANDYATLSECQSHITNATTSSTTTTESQPQEQCVPKWECFFNETAAWSECIDGKQTRTCVDTSGCTSAPDVSTRPPEEQSCTGGITTAAVAEGGEEEQPKEVVSEQPTSKGFFSFVGSAIVGPIFKSKIGIVFVILLILIVCGFLVYKFFLKDKLKLKPFAKKKFLFVR